MRVYSDYLTVYMTTFERLCQLTFTDFHNIYQNQLKKKDKYGGADRYLVNLNIISKYGDYSCLMEMKTTYRGMPIYELRFYSTTTLSSGIYSTPTLSSEFLKFNLTRATRTRDKFNELVDRISNSTHFDDKLEKYNCDKDQFIEAYLEGLLKELELHLHKTLSLSDKVETSQKNAFLESLNEASSSSSTEIKDSTENKDIKVISDILPLPSSTSPLKSLSDFLAEGNKTITKVTEKTVLPKLKVEDKSELSYFDRLCNLKYEDFIKIRDNAVKSAYNYFPYDYTIDDCIVSVQDLPYRFVIKSSCSSSTLKDYGTYYLECYSKPFSSSFATPQHKNASRKCERLFVHKDMNSDVSSFFNSVTRMILNERFPVIGQTVNLHEWNEFRDAYCKALFLVFDKILNNNIKDKVDFLPDLKVLKVKSEKPDFPFFERLSGLTYQDLVKIKDKILEIKFAPNVPNVYFIDDYIVNVRGSSYRFAISSNYGAGTLRNSFYLEIYAKPSKENLASGYQKNKYGESKLLLVHSSLSLKDIHLFFSEVIQEILFNVFPNTEKTSESSRESDKFMEDYCEALLKVFDQIKNGQQPIPTIQNIPKIQDVLPNNQDFNVVKGKESVHGKNCKVDTNDCDDKKIKIIRLKGQECECAKLHKNNQLAKSSTLTVDRYQRMMLMDPFSRLSMLTFDDLVKVFNGLHSSNSYYTNEKHEDNVVHTTIVTEKVNYTIHITKNSDVYYNITLEITCPFKMKGVMEDWKSGYHWNCFPLLICRFVDVVYSDTNLIKLDLNHEKLALTLAQSLFSLFVRYM